ncbi:MAG: hypothetical protein ACJ79X_04675 [Gemmatimonadaceae bacterium]
MRLTALAATIALAACSDDKITSPPPVVLPAVTVTTATGNIAAKVDEFRNLLGPSNGTTAGEQVTGRREITWDGAGANQFDNKNDFPANFFNTNVKAGAIFTTGGTGFRNDSTDFAEVNASYAAQFNFFSANKIFAPVGSNQLDQLFQVAGQPTPATTRGFGIVFSDVDVAEKTIIEVFAQDGSSIGKFAAPVRSDAGGLSFLGVTFDNPIIARVRITLGTGALAAGVNDITGGGTVDLVVLDNLIYGEPHKAF